MHASNKIRVRDRMSKERVVQLVLGYREKLYFSYREYNSGYNLFQGYISVHCITDLIILLSSEL